MLAGILAHVKDIDDIRMRQSGGIPDGNDTTAATRIEANQTNANLGNPAGWGNFSGTVNDNGTTKSVTVPAQPGNSYFRLKQ